MKQSSLCLLLLGSLMVACDDSSSGPTRAPDDASSAQTDISLTDSAQLDSTNLVMDAGTVVDAHLEPLAWIELEIDQTRALYKTNTPYPITVRAYNRIGEEVPATDVVYRTEPEGSAEVVDNAVSFTASGPGLLLACMGEICGERAFRADDGPPRITVTQPARAAAFTGEDERQVTVAGTVQDLSTETRVYVNGEPVETNEMGQFETQVQAEFGTNTITVFADDGISLESTTDTRDVQWAPRYIPVSPEGVSFESAGLLRLDQRLFGSGRPPALNAMQAEIEVESLGHLLEVFFALIDVETLLDADALFGADEGAVSIREASLGPAEVDFLITDFGLELFLRFPEVSVTTGGSIELQGASLDLDGTITIAVAARIELILDVQEQFTVDVGDSAVVVESVVGDFAAPGVGALLTVGGGGIGRTIETAFGDLVDDVVRTQIADFTRDALLGLFGDLRNLPLELDPGIEGAEPVQMTLSLYPVSAEHRPAAWSRYVLDGGLFHGEPIELKANDPGVVALPQTAWPSAPGDGIGIGLRLSFFNALLHEVWRAGLLEVDFPPPEGLELIIEAVRVSAQLPPMIVPTEGRRDTEFELQIGELAIFATSPGAAGADEFRVSLRSGMVIRFDSDNLELRLDDVPDVTVQLVEQVSEQPLSTSLLEVALQQIVWEQISAALVGGLDLGLGTIEIDPEALAAFAPQIISMTAAPEFSQERSVQLDQLNLEGALRITLGLAQDNLEMPAE